MSDQPHDSTEFTQKKERLSRRRLFGVATKIGAGLFSFVPAVQILMKEKILSPTSPGYVPCQVLYCYQTWCTYKSGGTAYKYTCIDQTNNGFCCCSNCNITGETCSHSCT